MSWLAIPPSALYLCWVWQKCLQDRHGSEVSPDSTIPVGFATLTGWALIAFAAATACLVIAL